MLAFPLKFLVYAAWFLFHGPHIALANTRYFRPFERGAPLSGTAAAARSFVENKREDDSMASAQEEAAITARLARENDVSEEAVKAVFDALRRGGGTMAQFSHADFGGMSQWSSGMTMVGDMFNDSLKIKLNAIAGELSRYLREHPVEHPADDRAVSYRSSGTRHAGSWWPQELGDPSSVGSQNDMRYAVFPEQRRLVIDDHGRTIIYDTSDHHISGVSQSQSTDTTLTFVSQHGVVRVSDLARADGVNPEDQARDERLANASQS